MLFSRSIIAALLSAPFLVLAQEDPLSFTIEGSFQITAGEPVEITWQGGSPSDTVTLVLRSGDAANLDAGTIIASDIPNTGSYEWTAPEDTTAGDDYALQIVNDANPEDNNYTGSFVLTSENTVPSETPIVSVGPSQTGSTLPTSEASLAPTQSPSAFPTTNDASSTITESSSASPTSESETETSATTTSEPTTASESDLALNPTTTTDEGSAPRATAVGAMLGAVALAAFAL